MEGGLNDSDLTPHLERPSAPLDHHLAGLIVVANHGAVRIRDVAKRARDVLVRSTQLQALTVSRDIPGEVLDCRRAVLLDVPARGRAAGHSDRVFGGDCSAHGDAPRC
jgi:hypothetical protein